MKLTQRDLAIFDFIFNLGCIEAIPRKVDFKFLVAGIYKILPDCEGVRTLMIRTTSTKFICYSVVGVECSMTFFNQNSINGTHIDGQFNLETVLMPIAIDNYDITDIEKHNLLIVANAILKYKTDQLMTPLNELDVAAMTGFSNKIEPKFLSGSLFGALWHSDVVKAGSPKLSDLGTDDVIGKGTCVNNDFPETHHIWFSYPEMQLARCYTWNNRTYQGNVKDAYLDKNGWTVTNTLPLVTPDKLNTALYHEISFATNNSTRFNRELKEALVTIVASHVKTIRELDLEGDAINYSVLDKYRIGPLEEVALNRSPEINRVDLCQNRSEDYFSAVLADDSTGWLHDLDYNREDRRKAYKETIFGRIVVVQFITTTGFDYSIHLPTELRNAIPLTILPVDSRVQFVLQFDIQMIERAYERKIRDKIWKNFMREDV